MKEYIKPILDIYEFDTEDEITASIVYENNNGKYADYLTNSQQQTQTVDTDTEFFDADIWE